MKWKKDKAFVRALLRRAYVIPSKTKPGKLHACCTAGLYLYMYELWLDGKKEAD